jgi:predicted DNA-binding transcriptional regulator AlpA
MAKKNNTRKRGGTEMPNVDGETPRRMLTVKEVLDIVRVGRTTLYRLERDGNFPRSTYVSANRRVWYADEVIDWQKSAPRPRWWTRLK